MHDQIFVALQRLSPQHLLSRCIGVLASSENEWLKNILIRQFIQRFDVDMDEALRNDPFIYKSFNDFFIRELHSDARPIAQSDIVCPADGTISQLGTIEAGKIFQAKGHHFSLEALIGDKKKAKPYSNGKFATIYLSPKDYHRVHMPVTGILHSMTHIPGKLFSVNQATTENLSGVFARNERVVCHFETTNGPMIVVMVGAMIVASIETVWAGLITPIKKRVHSIEYTQAKTIELAKGEEMGRFLLGSTAIVLLPENAHWDSSLTANSPIKMGQTLGEFIP